MKLFNQAIKDKGGCKPPKEPLLSRCKHLPNLDCTQKKTSGDRGRLHITRVIEIALQEPRPHRRRSCGDETIHPTTLKALSADPDDKLYERVI